MENEMIYTVYIHTCSVNNKKYIGITRNSVNRRWDCGRGYKNCPYFSKAIQKYGWGNFKHEVVLQNLTKDEAEMFEVEMIKYYKTTDRSYGYNLDNGGNHRGKTSDETRAKMSKLKKGKKLSPEHIAKLVLSHKGKRLTDEQKEKISKANKGKVMSAESRAKMSIAQTGEKNGFYGKKISKKHKKKLLKINSRPVKNIDTGKRFKSVAEAAKFYNIHKGNLSAVCRGNGKCKRCGGFRWKYI